MLSIQPARRRTSLIVSLALLLLFGGGYAIVVSTSPLWAPLVSLNDTQTVAEKITTSSSAPTQAALYVPKINIEVPYSTGDATALEHGAWWRSPDSGNPKDGGNFVLAAHRFQMGWTPAQAARQSPFYSIDKLSKDDEIVVDYEGVRYLYHVTEIRQVSPREIEIETPTDDNRLTLYSCTFGGSYDGRDVIIAQQQATLAQ